MMLCNVSIFIEYNAVMVLIFNVHFFFFVSFLINSFKYMIGVYYLL